MLLLLPCSFFICWQVVWRPSQRQPFLPGDFNFPFSFLFFPLAQGLSHGLLLCPWDEFFNFSWLSSSHFSPFPSQPPQTTKKTDSRLNWIFHLSLLLLLLPFLSFSSSRMSLSFWLSGLTRSDSTIFSSYHVDLY